MFNLFNKLLKLPSFFRWYLMPDQQQVELALHFRTVNARAQKLQSSALVLVQCVEDNFYFGLFGQIISSLREHRPLRVEQFVLRSLNVGESESLGAFIKSGLINKLLIHKWTRLYGSFCDDVGYRSASFKPIGDLIDLYQARKCWQSLNDKNSLIQLKIHGVPVGDLVNDSFLRFKPAPSVDLNDRYLWLLIWQAYRDIRRAKEYFGRRRPDIFLTSYSTYVQHGIAVRVALQHAVPVFAFGNYQEFTKRLSLSDWVHSKNPDAYANEFSKLSEQETRLALAETFLSARMAGVIDQATSYMRKSAYVESGEPVPDVNGAVVIFLHDFYDSPHIYRGMVFPDFWEWACFTIETLDAKGIPFFIKPHPNQINLSDVALSDLKKRYPGMRIIPSCITNKQLVAAGMICAVTVYGTVASEMAFLGVPSVTCAHHPHISFDFCKAANNKSEYVELLSNCREFIVNKSEMRRQSMAFYYMHNLNLDEANKALLESIGEFRMSCATPGTGDLNLLNYLKTSSSIRGYNDHISMWLRVLSNANRKGQSCD